MLLKDLNGKSVCILGYGKEGRAMVKALEEFAPACVITIADNNPEIVVENDRHGKQVGARWLKNLNTFNVIIKSPGIPPSALPPTPNALLTNSTDIFLAEAAARGATIIGITGSKGKSTTATLIFEILKEAYLQPFDTSTVLSAGRAQGRPATCNLQPFLVGNIGEPAIAHIKDIHLHTFFVQEMSSYQLMDCHMSPPIAVITSFFPEHLDYHGSVEAYKDAKSHITRFQSERDFVVYDALLPGAEEIAFMSPGKRIAAHAGDFPLQSEPMQLQGEHNRRNAAIAFLTTRLLGIPERIILPVIQNFRGLPHRLQSLGIHRGIEWIDDGISTTPESTIAALDALGDRVTAIILGGQDRGNDFTALGHRIAASNIKTVILFPGSGPRIRKAIEETKASIEFFEAITMQEAIKQAQFSIPNSLPAVASAKEGQFSISPVVLLSTASPSYGMFRNFEEKGDVFYRCIQSLDD